MACNEKVILDAQTIEETVDEIGYDILDSIIEDGTFSDIEFENTMEMFNETFLQKSLDTDDLNFPCNPELNIESSLEPINLDDIENFFETNSDAKQSFDTDKKSNDTQTYSHASKHRIILKKHYFLDDFKPYSSLLKKNLNENLSHQRTQQSVDIESILHPNHGKNNNILSTNACSATSKIKAIKEKKTASLSLSDGSKYRDLSMIADDEAVANINYENLRGRTKELFPVKLHKVIEYSERYGFSSIISWMPHGRAFKIHKENVFIEKVMPHFFYQSKMSSFTRQLRMYGFHRIKGKNNVDKGAYFHELFLRGRPGLTHGIIRLDKPCSLHKSDEPSFYLYRPMPSSPENDHQKSQSDTPTCIRYSDSLSREKPASVNTKLKNSLSAEDKKNGSNATIHKSSLIANNAAIPSLQNSLHFGPRPQAINSYIRQGVQVIYVFHGGHITNNRPVPLHFVSPDVLYK